MVTKVSLARQIDFVKDVQPIFQRYCYECHGDKKQKSGLRLDIKSKALTGGDNHGPDIIPGKPSESPLIKFITHHDPDERMPPKKKLPDEHIQTLTTWIQQGAVWPDGVDTAGLPDLTDHWSFKPLGFPKDKNNIDAFIDAKLASLNLKRSPPATPAAWLRRVTFDLTGLPPTPAELKAFTSQKDPDFATEVDRLLASPRYGERWAQHWLDVVRYADTHGFEVNTERPNAWPYRDYVIRALNEDLPYHQFVKEQIVGDAMRPEADPATGFLVTASVLLPGQIGKDAPSIRLARQDSIDEIVNNIGHTFLGLSISCARCHDHKFDPISAKDYYAMQAFVSGVTYADRRLRSTGENNHQQSLLTYQNELNQVRQKLTNLSPLARPGSRLKMTNPKENTETFPPTLAKFIKFTIHETAPHPTLGEIGPCLDELEIYSSKSPKKENLALASNGTRVTASGSLESGHHRLSAIHDGIHGNASSWIASDQGNGWVTLELPEPTEVDRIVWSRDRTGQYRDRFPTAYTLEVGPTPDQLTTVASSITPRPAPGAGLINVDRFSPVLTQKIRFLIHATNSIEPCLDELEVFNTAGQNIALVSAGATVKTSGNTIVADRHDPSHLNDGEYGNSRSWMGNQVGKGWVEITFTQPQTIDQAHWSRDRLGKFVDRLPIEYQLQAHLDGQWQTIADSTDRRPNIAGMVKGPEFIFFGLSQEQKELSERLLKQKSTLEKKIRETESGQKAFAGVFRKPDPIHLLNRGDPEQPQERVAPAILSALGNITLPLEAPEQERRRVLADWIANPKNPLTARVMVNRIWQNHFGTGLVETPNDFGLMGIPPTHPHLLDWLAHTFIQNGWSIKDLHRRIVLSGTYRQANTYNPTAATKDAEARFLWRYPTRRLEAEAIRDSMLMVSGQLNLRMSGPGFNLYNLRGGLSGFNPITSFQGDGLRRMIYAHKIRREPDSVFGAFDCPDAGQSTARRKESTTPIQALNLFNSTFTLEQAKALADRVTRESGSDLESQIRHTYLLTLGRYPTAQEVAETLPVITAHGLPTLCRALFNSNEFLFLP